MTRLISIRKAQLLGCIISLIGIGLCGFATAHWHIIALFGVVAGKHFELICSFSDFNQLTTVQLNGMLTG